MKKNQNVLTRRDFIRGTAGGILGASILGVNWLSAEDKTSSSLVTLVRDEHVMDIEYKVDPDIFQKMLDQTVIRVTGKSTVEEAWLAIVNPDDIVGLVPTPWLNPTHDELTDAVKKALMNIGIPEENILNVQNSADKPKACTALISLPALKMHWLTGIGTVIKNYIMFSGHPRSYHKENSAKLGEIWNFPSVKNKTRLILVDALYPLCDGGPQVDPRYKWAYNGLIAGTDPVAVERVGMQIITEKRRAIRGESWPISPPPICVEAADKIYGLGTSNLDQIKLETFGWKKDLLL